MRFLRVLLPLIVVGVIALAPASASAADVTFFGPLIPEECHCDEEGSAPDFGCALAVVQNAMNLAISLSFIIFALVIAAAGVLFIASPISARNRELGRTMMLNSVVGLVIALSGWLLVDFVMKTLFSYNEGASAEGVAELGPWNSILGPGEGVHHCLQKRNPDSTIPGLVGDPGQAPTTSGDATAAAGRATKVNAFINAASGLEVVYEVPNSGRERDLEAAGVPAGKVITVSGVAEHFSVYLPGWNGQAATDADRTNRSCEGCVSLSPIPVKSSNSSQAVPALKEKLLAIPRDSSTIGSWRVTEAYPNTVRHASLCHYRGTCVDVNFF